METELLNINSDEEKVIPKVLIGQIRRSRVIHKRKITLYLKKLKELHEQNSLTSSFCKNQIKEIELHKSEIMKLDEKINNILDSEKIDVCDESYCNAELDEQAAYIMQLGLDLDKYEEYLIGTSASSNISTERVLDMMSKLNMRDVKPPSLECGTFTGREKDKFAFNTFLNQFNNVIGSWKNMSDSAK